jgi:hypothetical protein
MIEETWVTNICSGCDSKNWICLGDIGDVSGITPDGYKCWSCGLINPFDDDKEDFCDFQTIIDEEERKLSYEELLDKYGYIDDGVEKPS